MAEEGKNITVTTSEEYNLWGRVGYVEIYLGEGLKPLKFKGLDYKFKVEKILDNRPNGNVEVSVLGLSQDMINKVVTVCSQSEAQKIGKRVRVYAGYSGMDDKNPNYEGDCIIDADIAYAKVDSPPPEMWVSIVGIIGYRYHFSGISINLNTVVASVKTIEEQGEWKCSKKIRRIPTQRYLTYYEVCQSIVDVLNKESNEQGRVLTTDLDFRASNKTKSKIVSSFYYSKGSVLGLMEYMGNVGDCYCFLELSSDISHQTLVVMNKKRSRKDDDEEEASPNGNLNNHKRSVRHKYLSKDSGLIGIPSVANTVSLQCRCLLDPKLTVGDYVHITSQIMPCVNGKWQILNIRHTGHFRGTEWYTDITAVDPSRITDTSDMQAYQSLLSSAQGTDGDGE